MRVEHDILADRLQGEELMTALIVIVVQGDDTAKQLKSDLGGKTRKEAQDAAVEEQDALETRSTERDVPPSSRSGSRPAIDANSRPAADGSQSSEIRSEAIRSPAQLTGTTWRSGGRA